MAANTSPIYPVSPLTSTWAASLAAVTACTTRAPTSHATVSGGGSPNYCVALVPTSTNGARIDTIKVQACSTSITAATVAQTVLIWKSNGTTAFVVDEIPVTAVTPSTTVAAFSIERSYSNLLLGPADTLWASTTVTTTASTTALSVIANGGLY